MLELRPKGWLSWDFHVLEDGEDVAYLDRHWLRERASFRLDGVSYEVRRPNHRLRRGSKELGRIRPMAALRRRAVVDLTEAVPLPLQLFVACLVLMLWEAVGGRDRGGLVTTELTHVRREGSPAWRLIADTDPADGPTNMAIDQALLDSVAAGAPPALRFYRWDPPTLSFGRNQPARGLYDTARAASRGIAFVRRPTGGQAVLHDDELTYAVVAPISAIGRPRAAYMTINRALVAGLRRLGVDAVVASGAVGGGASGVSMGRGDAIGAVAGSGSAHDWRAACFRRPERGEVEVGGAKLVGSAQRTEARTILQHGSILMGGSQAPAEQLLAVAGAAMAAGSPAAPAARAARPSGGGVERLERKGGAETGNEGWTTLDRELGARPDVDALVDALVAGFREIVGVAMEAQTLAPAEREAADRLEARFAADAWTWRR